MALWPIFEVCMQETWYEGGGQIRGPWCRQTSADAQLRAFLKEILEDARERRKRIYGSHGRKRYHQGDYNGKFWQEIGQRHWRREILR